MLDQSYFQFFPWFTKNLFRLLFIFSFTQATAQIIDPFSVRYQNQQKGGISLLSNSSVSCTNCATTTAQIPPTGNGQNNNFTMSYIDVDGQSTTFMSSSDSLNLPNCSEVLWAGLYWSARVGGNGFTPASVTNYSFRNQVRLRVNNGAYVPLTADELFDNTVGHQTYHCYKNITPIVQAAGGNARFTVANLVTRTGTNSMYGGWTIVVVYKNVFESMRNLTVFDGLANVSAGNTVTIPITGFLTPLTGPVNFELGVVSHDGDRSQTGDQLQFNGVGTNYVNVSDALHDVNDVFNSTMSRNGVLTPFRIPSFNNSLGHDASVFFPNNSTYNYIGNNSTSANIRITTGGETILTSVVTSVIDVYEPDLRATVYMSDLNGGLVQPGDILEYTLVGKNIGSDISNGTFMSDTLDPRTVYLPNSISINFGPNLGPKTDVYGDDQAEYDPINRVVIARIGTGATATAGGVVVNSPTGADSTVVKFRVTVINDCLMFQCDPTLDHKAYIFGTGNISGNAYNNGGLSDLYDANGCPTVANNALLIDVAGCPPAAIDYNDPICVGENLQFTYPFSSSGNYTWIGPNNFTSTMPNPSIQNVTTAGAGQYTVAVSFNGLDCIIDTTISVVVSTNPTISLNTITNVSCFGFANGALSVTANGTAPFSYSWTNGNNTPNPSGLVAGNYTLTLTDANTCVATASYLVTQPTQLTSVASVTSNYNGFGVSCFGSSNGTVSVTASGGSLPYSYLWANGSSSNSAVNLPAGSVSVAVTDANGCVSTSSAVLNQPTDIELSHTEVNVSCFGGSNGSINLSVSGGVAPFSYQWTNGALTQDLSGLMAGSYTVIVTDANGCVISDQEILTQPVASLSGNTAANQIACFGLATGTIDATISGGTVPYSFLWSNGQLTEDLSGQLAGNYTLNVSDANGCVLTLNQAISQPQAPLTLSEVHTDALCIGGLSGTIDLTVTGGTAPYVYSWNNLAITQDISNLQAGVYTCTVTDANGCTKSISVSILDPSNTMTLSLITTNVSCFNGANGAIDLTVNGGNPGFTYQWSNQGVTQDIIGLTAGNYAVTVLDNLGCGAFTNAVITEPATAIQSNASIQNVLCNGLATGSVDMTTQGGVPPYLFTWNSGQQTEDITGVLAGTYILQVTDAAGCVYTTTQFVAQPALPLDLSETHIDVSCFAGSNGSINLTTTGGVGNYVYNWSNNQVTEDLTGLIAGNYTASVTDGNGCLAQITVPITQPLALLSLAQLITNVSCNGGNNGAIDVTVTGGTAPYTFNWSNTAVSEDINGLIAGSYTLNVTDANGCTASITGVVTQPTVLTATSNPTPVSCNAGSNGTVVATPSGGTTPYSYNWSNGQTTALISGLTAGTYTCTITDANGCTVTTSATVLQPTQLSATTSQIDVLCNGNSTGSVSVQATGGVPGYTYLWSTNGTGATISSVPAGTYSVTVTDANLCTTTVSATVTEPLAPISATLQVTDNSCFNGSIGAIDATVSGGVGPYQYMWSNSQQTQDITGLVAGNYQLMVTDANGCQLPVSAVVDQPDQITLVNSIITNVSCFGGNNGSIDITPTGGTSPYSYSWSTSQLTEDLTGLIIGSYSVTVFDANNCSNQFNFTITEPTQLVGTYSAVEPLCFGYSDGQLTGIANGGVIPYSYSWSNGPITALNSQIPTGNYILIITDNNGCQVEVNAFLDEPEQLEVSYSVSDTIGCDPLTIQLTNTSTEQFNCVWNLGNGSTLNGCDVPFTFDNPGCYDITLTVTSSLGCSNFIQYDDIVCVLPSPTAAIEANPEWLDSSDPTVEVTNTSIGAVSYVWDMGDGSELLTVNQPGLYTYPLYQLDQYTITQIVTAENGCTDTAFYTVEIDNDLLIYIPNTFTPDNDEYNPQFKPVIASQITAYHLSIYNRWGEILFESFDKNVGWDGTYNGTIVQNGTYIWTAVVSTNGTNKIVKNGHVNLIR
jgi:gliding motility-associated-like protein/uncharacterized repeat protein (TIGR01451 family)